MLTRTIKGKENRGPHNWLYNRTDIWTSDIPVTDEEVKHIVDTHYGKFPVVYTKTTISHDRLAVSIYVEEDDCM